MGIYVHADDLGLTQGINAGIEACIKAGRLHSVSIMPNGFAVEEAQQILRMYPKVLPSIHLNLIEGPALATSEIPNVLTNDAGFLNKSFIAIWKKSLVLQGEQREIWVQAIRNELAAQLEKGVSLLPPHAPVRIDGHQHIHMIPIVAEALAPLLSEYSVSYVRIPRERFFFPNHPADVQIALGSNFLKVKLINDLINRVQPFYNQVNISQNTYFIGLLFTGKMNVRRLQVCYDKIKRDITDNQHVEILFHPGRASESERIHWAQRPKLASYYLSAARDKERNALLSDSMLQWMQQNHI